jgi:hypothetical protein
MSERDLVAVDGRARTQRRVTWGLALLWAGLVAEIVSDGLNPGALPVRTLAVLVLWALCMHRIEVREPAAGVLAELQALPVDELVSWVVARLRELGYTRVTPMAGSAGVDLLAEAPDEVAVVQCRTYEPRPVNEQVLQDLCAAMCDLHADRAYLVTTGRLTPTAEAWAAGKPLTVWDGQYLAGLASVSTASPT